MNTGNHPVRIFRIMNEILATALRENTEALIRLIGKFDQYSFNCKPTGGGWSAAEIAEHVLMFNIRANDLFSASGLS
jgi:hypothetical protein